MIRAILALLFAVLYLILGIPVLFVEWIIRKCNRHAADISSLRMVQWAFRVILFICGTKVTVIGEENVPKDQAVLYIGNHRSYFDIIITYARCPRLTGYIAKKDMEKVLDSADGVICTGTTLSNGTFDRVIERVLERSIPLTVYAQTGSAVAARFVGAGITSLVAEPFPFSQFSANATRVFCYRGQGD